MQASARTLSVFLPALFSMVSAMAVLNASAHALRSAASLRTAWPGLPCNGKFCTQATHQPLGTANHTK